MTKTVEFDLVKHLHRQREFSEKTFGPGDRAKGVVAHIRKELVEIEQDPQDLEEWIDVVLLALDGAWRTGASPEAIAAKLYFKQGKNERREWPDWRTMSLDDPIQHVKTVPETIPLPPSPPPKKIICEDNPLTRFTRCDCMEMWCPVCMRSNSDEPVLELSEYACSSCKDMGCTWCM